MFWYSGVEKIIGGSQREERYDILAQRIKDIGQKLEDYWWYIIELRKFGPVPRSGLWLGFERMVQFCAEMNNIRDVIPYSRTPKMLIFKFLKRI